MKKLFEKIKNWWSVTDGKKTYIMVGVILFLVVVEVLVDLPFWVWLVVGAAVVYTLRHSIEKLHKAIVDSNSEDKADSNDE